MLKAIVCQQEELQEAIESPEAFVQKLLSSTSEVGKTLAIARLQPRLEKALVAATGMAWEGIVPVLKHIDSMKDLQAALDGPAAFLESLLSAASPYAMQMALARVEAQLRPLLNARGVAWEQAATVVGLFDLQELQQGVMDPGGLVARVVDLVGGKAGAT